MSTTSLALVFPGQGSQSIGMLAGAVDKMKAAAPVVENLDAVQLDTLRASLLAALDNAMAGLMLAMAGVALAAAAIALFGLPGHRRAPK